MTEKFNCDGMYQELKALGDEKEYEAFLREQSLAKDHSFLIASIKRSNLRPAVRNVLEELIRFGKIRRPKHRPRRPADEIHIKGLQRALCVLDLEAGGWDKRESAIEQAKDQLGLSYSTIEKAVLKYETVIKGLSPKFLNRIRTAFK